MKILAKIPSQIKIGALRANVTIVPYIHADDNFRGLFNQRTEELQIDNQLGGRARDMTFLHEILHMIAINYELGENESDVSRLANGIFEFLYYGLGIELDWSDISGTP
ncbi:hypothetical protein LCGC14_2756290 [marine sediment metagenome]|uniref:Metallopeptidase domain-containing protein n=1 Tax=marine sediment metagenome TaxID=412755 RepID=A0A0F8Z0F5_9ZZZZ